MSVQCRGFGVPSVDVRQFGRLLKGLPRRRIRPVWKATMTQLLAGCGMAVAWVSSLSG
jgi:hypothetical protein